MRPMQGNAMSTTSLIPHSGTGLCRNGRSNRTIALPEHDLYKFTSTTLVAPISRYLSVLR